MKRVWPGDFRGGLIYSPQMPETDANRKPVISVLTLATGELQTFGEGLTPLGRRMENGSPTTRLVGRRS